MNCVCVRMIMFGLAKLTFAVFCELPKISYYYFSCVHALSSWSISKQNCQRVGDKNSLLVFFEYALCTLQMFRGLITFS